MVAGVSLEVEVLLELAAPLLSALLLLQGPTWRDKVLESIYKKNCQEVKDERRDDARRIMMVSQPAKPTKQA